MKKIKNIKELHAKEKELEQRRIELEKAIKYDAKDLGNSFSPDNLSKKVLSSVLNKKENAKKGIFSLIKRFF